MYTFTATPSAVVPLITSSSPTTNASRYVDMMGERAYVYVVSAPSADATWVATGMLERAVRPVGTVMITSNVALKHGSSQHGSARRASVASNCTPTQPRVVTRGHAYSRTPPQSHTNLGGGHKLLLARRGGVRGPIEASH